MEGEGRGGRAGIPSGGVLYKAGRGGKVGGENGLVSFDAVGIATSPATGIVADLASVGARIAL